MFPLENHIGKKKMAAPTVPPVMIGGVRNILVDFSMKHVSNVQVIITILLVLGITFPTSIPIEIRHQASTTLGRLFLFGGLLGVLQTGGWLYGILAVIFISLVLSTVPGSYEGFQNTNYSLKLVDEKKRWWVEEILHENPIAIEAEKVKTAAVQDDDLQARSSVQDSKSSSR
jgi:hypothetical protein